MSKAMPGLYLGEEQLYKAGQGTYCLNGKIYSSCYGQINQLQSAEKFTLYVSPNANIYLPNKGDKVFCTVLN